MQETRNGDLKYWKQPIQYKLSGAIRLRDALQTLAWNAPGHLLHLIDTTLDALDTEIEELEKELEDETKLREPIVASGGSNSGAE